MRLRTASIIGMGRWLFAAGLVLSLGGCDLLALVEPPEVPPARACQTDEQCAVQRGEVCRLADGSPARVGTTGGFEGICVIRSTGSQGKVFLEVRPEAGSLVPPTQVGPIDLSAGQNQEIVLPPPVSFQGEVIYQGTFERQPVPRARVRFRSRPLIAGRPQTFETETATHDAVGRFTRVLPQGTYSLHVQPPDVDEIRAPPERPAEEVNVSAAKSGGLVIAVSHPGDLIKFTGRAVVRNGDQTVPLEGAEVWAVDAPRSAMETGSSMVRLLTQPTVLGADGAFTLWLPRRPASGNEHQFQLRFGPTAERPALPAFRPSTQYGASADVHLSDPIVLGNLDEPTTVHGVVRDDRSLPVPGARVTFRHVGDDAFSYNTTTQTDVTGAFTAMLHPGRYSAVAQPPPGRLAHCPLGAELEVRRDRDPEVRFVCETRRWLTGRIIDREGNPVSGVEVDATRRPDDALPDELHEQSRRTDGEGHFRLFLTPGLYDLMLRPLPDSKLPFKTVREILIEDEVESLLVVELDRPFELFGRLLGGEGALPVGASLEAYAVDEGNGTVLVGRGLSTSDGRYSIVLPATTP